MAAGALLVSMPAQGGGPPSFSDYPGLAVSTEKVKSIDLGNSKKAREFKATAREAIGKAPNFAGHYVVVTQGCGSPCQAVALVEVPSGKVYVAPFCTALGSDFRAESRLFIDSPPENILEYYNGPFHATGCSTAITTNGTRVRSNSGSYTAMRQRGRTMRPNRRANACG
jgi:hypothetical protein